MKSEQILSAALIALPSLTSALPAFTGSMQDISAAASNQHKARALDPATVRYRAFGDSYSAGPGAGSSPNIEVFDKCKKYNGAYPHKLNEMLRPGQALDATDFVSCTGAVADEIGEQAKNYMTKDINLATVSLGGNNVGFSKIVNNCIYRFINTIGIGGWGKACEDTLKDSRTAIDNNLAGPVEAALREFDSRADDKAIIVVTGYAQFWSQDTPQCSDSNWAYWSNGLADHTPMTTQLRGKMNQMVQDVNGKISSVVDKINSESEHPKFHFVNYDPSFNNNRFCEEKWIEPQKTGDNRDGMVLGQYYTNAGQFAPDNDMMPKTGEWAEFADAFAAEIKNNTDAAVNPAYAPMDADSLLGLELRTSLVRVFHPTQAGHQLIAEAIRDSLLEMGQWPGTNGGPQPGTESLPEDSQPTCVDSMPGNFPDAWTFNDGVANTRNLFYRMRDEVCNGRCERIGGVTDGEFVLAKTNGVGCDVSIKVAAGKEVYMHASHSGNTCWSGTSILIDKCPNNAHKWIGGPQGEFFQTGFRPLNPSTNVGPGSPHADLNTESIHHVPYPQVACKMRSYPFDPADHYEIALRDFGDFDRLRHEIDSCNLLVSRWEVKDDSVHTFKDGNANTKYVIFAAPWSNGGCIESKIEAAMDLHAGGLDCKWDFSELDRMA